MTNYLDFYLKDNGKLEYTKDISMTQYSSDYTVRLITSIPYDIISMNVTLPDTTKTYKKNLVKSTNVNGKYSYIYTLGTDVTGISIPNDKVIVKIGFILYEDSTDTSKCKTTAIAYLPLLATTEPEGYDSSLTSSFYNDLSSRLNAISTQLNNLGIGEVDTAKNYNTEDGNIKSKFNLTDAQISSLKTTVEGIQAALGNIDAGSNQSIVAKVNKNESDISSLKTSLSTNSSSIVTLNTRVNGAFDTIASEKLDIISQVDAKDDTIKELINTNKTAIASNKADIETNSTNINNIVTNLLPNIQAGLKYSVVESLPNNPVSGVIYMIKTKDDDTSNVYTEFIHLDTSWEIIGTSETKVDLTNYYNISQINTKLNDYLSKDEASEGYYSKTETDSLLENKASISLLNTGLNNKADKANTLAGYGITDAYTKEQTGNLGFLVIDDIANKADKSNSLAGYGILNAYTRDQTDSKISGAVSSSKDTITSEYTAADNSLRSDLTTNINANTTRIGNVESSINYIQTDISGTIRPGITSAQSRADSAYELAASKSYAKVFASKADMVTYIQAKHTDPITVGTSFFILDDNVPDYWVVAIYESATSYLTQMSGESFSNVYYAVEPVEGKIDLSNYATLQVTDALATRANNLETRATNLENDKENLSNKLVQGENDNSVVLSHSDSDVLYPTSKAVYKHVDYETGELRDYVDTNYYTGTASENYYRIETGKTNSDSISTLKENIDTKNSSQDSDISSLESGLSTEIANRTSGDNTLTENISTEVTRAKNAETILSNGLSSEITRAKGSESTLTANLDNEISRATEAEAKTLSDSKSYTDAEIKHVVDSDSDYVTTKSKGLVDYTDNSKTLHLSSSSTETDYTIDNVDIQTILNVMSEIEPNEYN